MSSLQSRPAQIGFFMDTDLSGALTMSASPCLHVMCIMSRIQKSRVMYRNESGLMTHTNRALFNTDTDLPSALATSASPCLHFMCVISRIQNSRVMYTNKS